MIFHKEEKASREDENIVAGVSPCLIVLKGVSFGIFCLFVQSPVLFSRFSFVV